MALFSGYNSDDPVGGDDLDVIRDTRILARLILSRYVEPPLSIGVFGEHGTGRSFFIHLLQRDLDVHASDSRIDLVHVPFNALINVETNPWIALVDSIYRSLESLASSRLALMPPGERDQLFEDLGGTARRLRSEAIAKLENAESAYRQAKQSYKAARHQHKNNLNKLANNVSWQRWKDIEDKYWPSTIGNAGQTIELNGKRLGVRNLDDKPEDLRNILDHTKSIEGIASIISASITATPMLGTLTLVFLVFLTVIGLGGIAFILKDSFTEAKDFLDAYGKTLGIIGTISGAFGALALVFMRNRARFALNRLRGFIDNLRKAEREADRVHSLNKALIEEDVAVSREALADRREHLQRTANDCLAAQQEYEKFLEPGILRRMIEFYRSTLISEADLGAGIVPVLREDIEALTQWLMQDGMVESSVGAAAVKGERQSRIVVCIDDLDRCPPEHVFAILQATNLLLSTPLFVVVMVMNPVVTMRALQPTYMALLQEQDSMGQQDTTGISALDYLERLIQIPFWLPKPDRQQIVAFVTEMLRPFEEPELATEADIAGDTAEATFAEVQQPELKLDEPVPDKQDVLEFDIDRLFTHAQFEYVRSLMLAVPVTPRTVKRFVNLCRLVNAELMTYSHGDTGLFEAVTTLLAIVVGLPMEAPRVFAVLGNTNIQSVGELIHEVGKDEFITAANRVYIREILNNFDQLAGHDAAIFQLREAQWLAARHSYNLPPS